MLSVAKVEPSSVSIGTQTNVVELDNTGQPVCKWCFVPDGSLVAGDVMLTQKIALETNERAALAVANRGALTVANHCIGSLQ